jgi:hypothetical protein
MRVNIDQESDLMTEMENEREIESESVESDVQDTTIASE